MEKGETIWVIGGDRRQAELARLLTEEGRRVHCYALERARGVSCEAGPEGLEAADRVILPLPALNGAGALNTPLSDRTHPPSEVLERIRPGCPVCAGMVTPELQALAKTYGLCLYDYFAREELTVANAIPTAEGAVRIALEELDRTLHGAQVLMLGYGRVGRVTAQRMAAMGAQVTVAARRCDQLAWAQAWGCRTVSLGGALPPLQDFDLVVNTVPAPVLGRGDLTKLKRGAAVIDLASKPGGVDFAAAEELGVRAIHALALPGREAPRSAAEYVKAVIDHIMKELEA